MAQDMARFDDSLRTKLSTLEETQPSITAVGSWILFHARNSERSALLWFERLKATTTPAKRLALIYLANEVAQNARSKNKLELTAAFAPYMPEAIQAAYKVATTQIQGKIRHVVEVWRQRQTFNDAILRTVESNMHELDKSRHRSGQRPLMGGSLFGAATAADGADSPGPGTVPDGLEGLAEHQLSMNKAVVDTKPRISQVTAEYDSLMSVAETDGEPHPSQVGRLANLVKMLSSAESAVSESIKTRKNLIGEVEKFLSSNNSTMQTDEEKLKELADKRPKVVEKKKVMEASILQSGTGNGMAHGLPPRPDLSFHAGARGLDGNGGEGGGGAGQGDIVDRPEVEPLTPPHISTNSIYTDGGNGVGQEAHTPAGTPPAEPFSQPTSSEQQQEEAIDVLSSNQTTMQAPVQPQTPMPAAANVNTADPRLKRKLEAAGARPDSYGSDGGVGSPDAKRRRSGHEKVEFEGFLKESGGNPMEGLDEDVVGMLG